MICRECGREFLLKSKHKKIFCTKTCKNTYHNKMKIGKKYNRHLHICATCGEEFYSNYKRAVFCSNECDHNFNIFIIDGIVHKKCTRCGNIKVREDNFYKGNGYKTRDGYNVRCIQCQAAWYQTPKGRAIHNKSKEKRKDKAKIEEKIRKSSPEFKDRRNFQESERLLKDNNFRLRLRMRLLIYTSLRVTERSRKLEELIGYSSEDLRKHIKKLLSDTEGMSWKLLQQGKIHIDHKIPVTNFCYTSPNDEDFKKCWSLDNLQPLWGPDNLKKSNKIGGD